MARGRRWNQKSIPRHVTSTAARTTQRAEDVSRLTGPLPTNVARRVVVTQALHVGNQMPGRVDAHVDGRVTGVWSTQPAAALVELDDPIVLGVERPPTAWARA